MTASAPHYLLYSASAPAAAPAEAGEWRFVLQSADGTAKLEIVDSEPDVHGERLELLAVVRGLEALEQPSRVTLVTPSRYVSRGISYGLSDWRDNGWQWERHGEMVPIKNHDLWQRIDRALEFHRIECRTEPATPASSALQWRIDGAHENVGIHALTCGGTSETASRQGNGRFQASERGNSLKAELQQSPDQAAKSARRPRIRLLLLNMRRAIVLWLERLWHRLREVGAPLFRSPWLD